MKKRYHMLDTLRGLTLISMIVYHGMWDLVYIYGVDAPWYESKGAYVWQQSICWTFILLSGFCWSLGRRHLKRGLLVFGTAWVISAATILFMPDSTILFGVLSLIGSAMLIMIPLDKVLRKINPYIGLLLSFGAFLVTKNVPDGYLGMGRQRWLQLPKNWYANLFTAYLGFPRDSFFSTDYFALVPWLFLFITGYFLYYVFKKKHWLVVFEKGKISPLAFMGRHSLVIYVIHQPIIYGTLYLWFNLLKSVL